MIDPGNGEGRLATGALHNTASSSNVDGSARPAYTLPLTGVEAAQLEQLRIAAAGPARIARRASGLPCRETYDSLLSGDVIHGPDGFLWGVESGDSGVTLVRRGPREIPNSREQLLRFAVADPGRAVDVHAYAGTDTAVEFWHRTTGRGELQRLRAEVSTWSA